MNADNVIKVPANLICDKFLDSKRVIAFASIIASDWQGSDYEKLARFSLYSGRRGKDSVSNQYKQIVRCFLDCGYLKQMDGGGFYTEQTERFGIIYHSEFQSILSFKEECRLMCRKFNHAYALLLLAHLRSHMDYRGGKPVFYANLLSHISKDTGLSVRSISSCLVILEEIGIIHSEELPRHREDNGCWHSNLKVFVNMMLRGEEIYDWQKETAKSIKWIRTHKNN